MFCQGGPRWATDGSLAHPVSRWVKRTQDSAHRDALNIAGGSAPGTVTITLGNDISFGNAVLKLINLHAGGVMRGAPRIHAQWKVNDFGGSGRTFETQMISL